MFILGDHVHARSSRRKANECDTIAQYHGSLVWCYSKNPRGTVNLVSLAVQIYIGYIRNVHKYLR